MSYNHNEIDQKWQAIWEQQKVHQAETSSPSGSQAKPKYYALDMFPYPSGAGLHVGHLASYMPTDIITRYKRACGFNVLHPMGYDAFGLPAEQYAIQTGIHPAITTQKSIENFRRQLKILGFAIDWSREISTCDPSYYKWTQHIFTILHERGLAYQKEVPVNWCPALRTVLANEEVVDGKSERGGHPVVRVPMKQWMLKITAYADRLLEGLDRIDWPSRTKEGQRNWIGKSVGAEIDFQIKDHAGLSLKVFTTRPDTLFGATFMVIAPEHPLVIQITTSSQAAQVKEYVAKAARKSEVERKSDTNKTGVATGASVLHPITGDSIPIWISDYVLMDYGTGAIMAVPAHDERDFEFASKFNLPIRRVLEGGDLPFVGEGVLVDSGFLNGLKKDEAIQKMISYLSEKKLGKEQIQFKLRDWLFSRQRYWGEPFPVVHFKNGTQTTKCLPVSELPVTLPEVANYEPSESGEPPLARATDWVRYTGAVAKSLGQEGVRETDTMPGSAGSSWYFLRFTDPQNGDVAFSPEAQKYWMPVDLYVGGPEHTVGHLLYARFWQKVLFDAGLVSVDEPFKKLIHQGMVLGPDGEKMSKSRGNTISPDEVVKEYGTDAVRAYICFMGPLEKDKAWSTSGIEGVRRFLDRVWRLAVDDSGKVIATQDKPSAELESLIHKTIKKVTNDIENFSFNTAISAMMIFVNEMYARGEKPVVALKALSQLLLPFCPHLAEELWKQLGGEGLLSLRAWPKYDEAKTIDSTIELAVQVNGKTRGTIQLAPDASEEAAVQLAVAIGTVKNQMEGKVIKKVIYKAGKILNLIVG